MLSMHHIFWKFVILGICRARLIFRRPLWTVTSIYLAAFWICLGFVSIESLAVNYTIKHVCKSLSFCLILNPLLKCSWWSLILELREIISHFPFPWHLCLMYLITASPAVISTSLPKAKSKPCNAIPGWIYSTWSKEREHFTCSFTWKRNLSSRIYTWPG